MARVNRFMPRFKLDLRKLFISLRGIIARNQMGTETYIEIHSLQSCIYCASPYSFFVDNFYQNHKRMIGHDNLSKLFVIQINILSIFRYLLKILFVCVLDNIMLKFSIWSCWNFVNLNAGKPVYTAFLTVINYFFGEKSCFFTFAREKPVWRGWKRFSAVNRFMPRRFIYS